MSLTTSDIQLIKEALQPEFKRIEDKCIGIDKRFDDLENTVNQLEINVITEFRIVHNKIDSLEQKLNNLVDEIAHDLLHLFPSKDEFYILAERVTRLEHHKGIQ